MKWATIIVLCAFVQLTLAPRVAFAQEPDIVPVKEGSQAPFTGLLIPEGRYVELLAAEVEHGKLVIELRLEKQYSLRLEPFLLGKVQEAGKQEWWDSISLNRWFGFTLGVIVTGLAIWGGIEVVKANSDAR